MSLDTPTDSNGHRTTQLAARLRRSIVEGAYRPGDLLPSERELCETHHLSRTTVRRAIQLLVDEGMLERVPGSGTYVGRFQRTQPTQTTLGLVIPTLANPYYAELSRAIEQEAAGRGYQLMIGQSDYQGANEANYLLRYAENPAISGALVVPSGEPQNAEIFQALREQQTAFVFVVRGVEGVTADTISTDHVGGARDVVRHLIGLGHRRIAFVGTARGKPHRHLQGYQVALAEAGLPADPALIELCDTDDETAGVQGVRALLQRGTAFTAIFGRVDITAVGVLRALREAGLRVPEDLSVVGFDNTQLAAHLQPALTTVEHMRHEIGRLAVAFLLDRIEGRYSETPRHVIIQPRLIVRASSGPVRA
jgi:DNA-binding LacI/PurR family transcriptional regulator